MFNISAAVWVVVAVLFWIGSTLDVHVAEALGSVAVAIFTGVLVVIGRRADKHFRVTERAYVKMSHITPPADELGQAFTWFWESSTFNVTYEVKNHGRTPAQITATGTSHEVLDDGQKWSLPTNYWEDPVDVENKTEAFLVCADQFRFPDSGEVTTEGKAAILGGKKVLIILGYIDYIDQFNVRHRSGYARQLVPGDGEKNNLAFPDEFPGLNYDRLRNRSEGFDWD